MLYREPKVLKGDRLDVGLVGSDVVSVLYREPKVLKGVRAVGSVCALPYVSVLYREPKVLKVTIKKVAETPAVAFQCSTVSRKY